MGILEVPEQVSVGSKTQPSLSYQTAAQRWRQLQESGDLNQGPTLLEFHCFFFSRKLELIFLPCLAHKVVLRIK